MNGQYEGQNEKHHIHGQHRPLTIFGDISLIQEILLHLIETTLQIQIQGIYAVFILATTVGHWHGNLKIVDGRVKTTAFVLKENIFQAFLRLIYLSKLTVV